MAEEDKKIAELEKKIADIERLEAQGVVLQWKI
jgi:hypothetical protein